MRITLVCPFDPRPPAAVDGEATVGGVERVFDQVAAHLARRGHDVTLLCSTAGEPGRRREDGVTVVRQRRRGVLLRTPVCDLAVLVPRTSQVVHVPATYPFTTAPVLRQARRLGVPAVLDFHFEPVMETPLGRAAATAYRAFALGGYRHAAAVVVRSLDYAAHSPSLQEVDAARLRVVPNGIDPARFHPNGPAHKGDYLLFVGRLVPYKGVDVLLRALAKAKAPNPLVLAGDGPERPRLEALAKRLGVDARFLGRVPDAGLPALYRGARLTLLPSVNRQEAFGITLIESMACGTPVVASHLPGVEEVANRGGLVAPPGDAEALAQRIRTALAYPALPRGADLARRIHRLYSWQAVAARLEQVYQEATRPKRKPHTHPAPAARPARPAATPPPPLPMPVAARTPSLPRTRLPPVQRPPRPVSPVRGPGEAGGQARQPPTRPGVPVPPIGDSGEPPGPARTPPKGFPRVPGTPADPDAAGTMGKEVSPPARPGGRPVV